MYVSKHMREKTELRNAFYKAICEWNKINRRYQIFRDNDYFDNHTFQIKAFNFWDWLVNGHTEIADVFLLDGYEKVHIVVSNKYALVVSITLGEHFESYGLRAIVSDNTVKAKETC
jgi:hypothetical protein